MTQPEWKQFQDLVSRIERLASQAGAIVRSPDCVPDVNTQTLREVDASIRYRVGTADILVTVEARKRSSIQDVTWIEQLATKRENIGANATIAVSATPFSTEAKSLASRKSIILRQVNHLSDDEIVALAAPVYQVTPLIDILEWGVSPHLMSDRPVTLSVAGMRLLRNEGAEAKIFMHEPSGAPSSLMDFVRFHMQKRGTELFDQVPDDGGTTVKKLRVKFPDIGTLTIINGQGSKTSLSEVVLRLRLSTKRLLLPPQVAVSYVAPEADRSLHHSEFAVEGDGGAMRLLIQRDSSEGSPRLGVELQNADGTFVAATLELIREVHPAEQD